MIAIRSAFFWGCGQNPGLGACPDNQPLLLEELHVCARRFNRRISHDAFPLPFRWVAYVARCDQSLREQLPIDAEITQDIALAQNGFGFDMLRPRQYEVVKERVGAVGKGPRRPPSGHEERRPAYPPAARRGEPGTASHVGIIAYSCTYFKTRFPRAGGSAIGRLRRAVGTPSSTATGQPGDAGARSESDAIRPLNQPGSNTRSRHTTLPGVAIPGNK